MHGGAARQYQHFQITDRQVPHVQTPYVGQVLQVAQIIGVGDGANDEVAQSL